MKRPVIPSEFGAKVPTNVRQRYLNIFIDECLKFCCSEQEAFQTVCHPTFPQMFLVLVMFSDIINGG